MHDRIMNAVAKIYEQQHVGVNTIKSLLDENNLQNILTVFDSNTETFHSLKFGNVTRWDLTEDDFQKNPALEICRDLFRRIHDGISATTAVNPVYKEKFSVMFYPRGSSGVKPHRDSQHSVNLVVIFVVSGDNPFFAAKDKGCKDSTEFQTNPGDAIVIRAPRTLADPLQRPIHYVATVTKPRFVMICRHINLEGLKR